MFAIQAIGFTLTFGFVFLCIIGGLVMLMSACDLKQEGNSRAAEMGRLGAVYLCGFLLSSILIFLALAYAPMVAAYAGLTSVPLTVIAVRKIGTTQDVKRFVFIA